METKQTRRSIRFTIRALFVAVLIVAAYCAGWSNSRMWLEEDAIKAARAQVVAEQAAAQELRQQQYLAWVEARRAQGIVDHNRGAKWRVLEGTGPNAH